jgi:hypothetical protein
MGFNSAFKGLKKFSRKEITTLFSGCALCNKRTNANEHEGAPHNFDRDKREHEQKLSKTMGRKRWASGTASSDM